MLFFTSDGVQGLSLMSISPDFLVPPSSRHVTMSNREVFPQPVEVTQTLMLTFLYAKNTLPYNNAIYICLMLDHVCILNCSLLIAKSFKEF